MRPIRPICAALALIPASLGATERPLSAIEWLDQPFSSQVAPEAPAGLSEPPVTGAVITPEIDVQPLGAPSPDSVGLLPTATTGLPRHMWRASDARELRKAMERVSPRMLPAAQALIYTLLLAEADPPSGTGEDAAFLRTRIEALVRFGAVDPARALLERADPAKPDLFDLWLNLTLLSGDEHKPCSILKRQPSLSPDYAARIYCIARAGDWMTAALTFETASALGVLDAQQTALLGGFLDPETIPESPYAPPDGTPSPLVFRLYEANGSPLPTRNLPLVFAAADLRGLSGWRTELEAAERLSRSGALPASQLFGYYNDRSPAASGGIWDRVRSIQTFDRALFSRDAQRVAVTLPAAWEAMQDRGLAVPFAQHFTPALLQVDLPQEVQPLALRVSLLSPQYEAAALRFGALSGPEERLLRAVARGLMAEDIADVPASDPLTEAIMQGLVASGAAERHEPLLQDGKLGEAILDATTALGRVSHGNARAARDSLRTLRAVGLEDTARRAALQLLILGPAR